MRLSLTFPTRWDVKHAPGDRHIAIFPGPSGQPRLIVTFGALTLLPDDQRTWIEQALLDDLPPRARISVGASFESQTAAGWPVRVVEARMLEAGSNQVIEERLCAFYAFMEHAAVAMLRAGDARHIEDSREMIREILLSGRPDWTTPGQPSCLAEVWNLDRTRSVRQQRGELPMPMPSEGTDGAPGLLDALREIDAAIAKGPSAARHLYRGMLLRQLGRHEEALTEFRSAAELAQKTETATASAPYLHWLGLGLAALGREGEAIAAWADAVKADPALTEAYYDAAQAHYKRKEFAPALQKWRAAFALDPSDFLTLRKIVQSLYALGKIEEGDAERARLRALWQKSSDPRARIIEEYVFDQFQEGGLTIHAYETVNERAPGARVLYTFRVVDEHDHPRSFAVGVEVGDASAPGGAAFVLTATNGNERAVIGTTSELPPYAELKATAARVLASVAATQS